jgi:hypothetical protein
MVLRVGVKPLVAGASPHVAGTVEGPVPGDRLRTLAVYRRKRIRCEGREPPESTTDSLLIGGLGTGNRRRATRCEWKWAGLSAER